jgi:cation diffusion facilitator family transporter
MVAEIVGGSIYGSLALVADGWHMSTHAVALAIAALAYLFARRYRNDPRFSFGTGKVGALAAFGSAIVLALVALLIAWESVLRLAEPRPIAFNEALAIAVLGLLVNLGSAWLLYDPQEHAHPAHSHAAGDHHHHDDLNLRAAYLHVLADALTSVLAIGALLTARFSGWTWIDPAVGLVGAGIIVAWAWSLIRSSTAALLDTVPSPRLAQTIRERLETGGDKVSDLHLWQLGPGHIAVIVSVISDRPQPAENYKQRIRDIAGISHVTVEVHACEEHRAA